MTNQTTMQQCKLEPANEPVEKSPFVVEYFMVRGLDFLGMAYRDEEGKWRNAFNHNEVSGDICFFE
jgi:hypothetical protein